MINSGIDTSFLDPATKPADDFFRYVNGSWHDSHVIPADRSRDGGMYFLRDAAEEHVREIIENLASQEPGSRIGALYSSFMDTEAIEAAGLAPLLAEVQPILEASTADDLVDAMADLDIQGHGGPVGWYTSIDAKNPEKYVIYLTQTGLGLPDESYYREDKYAELRTAYQAHLQRIFELTGLAENFGLTPADAAAAVLAHETELASHHWDAVKTRDADARYNPVEAKQLDASFPGFPYQRWLTGLGISLEQAGTVVVNQPSYFEGLGQMWQNSPLFIWKLWYVWQMAHSRAPYLTQALVDENFDFYGRTLSGSEQLRDRWKRGVALVESSLGEELGKEYVAIHFPPAHKAQMMELVEDLLEAYRQSIESLDWMTEETRTKALAKLDAFVTKIGYPDKWRDYSALEMTDDLFENLRRSAAFEHAFQLGRVHQPVDKAEWLMTPQTVNAYYMPPANEIVFPAAILQAPYFDPQADAAVNYGAIGGVIGHEIGHGFDDQGSKYDGTGALNNWWTETDLLEFQKRTAALVEQYNAYTPAGLDPEKFTVNGQLTLGENIGDLGGLSIALKAYQIYLERQGLTLETAPVLDGLTAAQRVFIAWAQGWRMKTRPQTAEMLLTVDPHSPEEFRVNGVVRNIDEFYTAFDVQPGDKLYLAPQDRVKIWS